MDKPSPLPHAITRTRIRSLLGIGNLGARRANKATDKDGEIWQPDFSDPLYLKYWGELVAEAGKRYDGNPYLDSVDISSVGYWGEGWSPYMPPFPNQKELIDIWLNAFQRTPLLMNFDEQQALTLWHRTWRGMEAGLSWDMRTNSDNEYFPAEMLEVYPQQVVRAGIQDVCSASRSHWKCASRLPVGRRRDTTLTIYWSKHCAGM